MKKIFLTLFFLTLFYYLSANNYVGFNNQYDFEAYGMGGWRSSSGLFGISPLLGFSHSIEAKKYFSFEYNILLGYKYRYFGSGGYGINSYSHFHGFNFLTDMNFCFRYGNDKVKFKFSLPTWFFSFSLGMINEEILYYDPDRDNVEISKFYYNINCGIKVIYIGLDIYIGKQNNILFTPVYLYGGFSWCINDYYFPLPIFNFGIGASLKFKINKK